MMPKLLIFGDSITWGAFDYEYGGWVERLKTHFFHNYKKNNIAVYNLGISGNNTRELRKHLKNQIESIVETTQTKHKDIIFLFSIGSNDPSYDFVTQEKVVSLIEFQNNIQAIISIAQKYTDTIIFTGFTFIDESQCQPWIDNECWRIKDLLIYESYIQNLCKNMNLHFIPLWHLLDQNLLSDGLHPDTSGHEKISQHIQDYLHKHIL